MKFIEELKIDGKPHFSLLSFYISLPFDISQIDNVKPKSIVDYAILLHEYTHYLQGFCTVYGVITLFKYFSVQHSIITNIVKSIVSKKSIDITFFESQKHEIDQINKIYFYDLSISDEKETPINTMVIIDKKHPVLVGANKEIFIKLDNSYLLHISPRCLRETMAMMAYFNIRGIGQESAYLFLDEENMSPMYKGLYQYLYNNFPVIYDLIKFTYFLCELALQSEKPGILFEKLINYLKSIKRYIGADDFFINFIKLNPQIKFDLNRIIEYIKIKINDINKLSKGLEYYTSISYYLNCCVNGLKYIELNNSIYNNLMDSQWLERMVVKFSSPVIISSISEDDICTLDNSRDIKELALLFAVSVMLEKYSSGEKFSKCPFIENIPICPLKNTRNEEQCNTDPYKTQLFNNGGCLFYNSNLILGMLPNEEIQKYSS